MYRLNDSIDKCNCYNQAQFLNKETITKRLVIKNS